MDHCTEFIAYEHEPDEEVNRVHVHCLMMGTRYKTPEQFKRQFYELMPGCDMKGNDLWSWKHKEYPNPDINFITYMTKGHLRPVLVKTFSPAEVERLRQLWVNPSERKPPPGKVKTKEGQVKRPSDWEIIEEVLSNGERVYESVEGEFGYTWEQVFQHNASNFRLLCNTLNKYRVKTNVHDLERWWVTLQRQSIHGRENLWAIIQARTTVRK